MNGQTYQELLTQVKSIDSMGIISAEYDVIFEKGLLESERRFGKDSNEYLDFILYTGRFFTQQGKYQKADSLFQLGLKACEGSKSGKKKPNYPKIWQGLSVLYTNTGDVEKGLTAIEYALLAYEKNSYDRNFALIKKGILLRKKNDFQGAKDCYQESIAYFEKNNLKNDDYGIVLRSLGNIENDIGNLPKAINAYHQSIAVFYSVFKEETSLLAETYGNLAVLYSRMSNYEKAIFYAKKAVKIFENKQSPANMYVARIADISKYYQQMSNMDSAFYYLNLAKEVCKKITTPNLKAEFEAFNLSRESGILMSLLEYDKTIALNQAAIKKIDKDSTGRLLMNYVSAVIAIGNCYDQKNDSEQALFHYHKVLKLIEKGILKQSEAKIKLYDYLVALYNKQKKYTESNFYLEKSLELRIASYGKESNSYKIFNYQIANNQLLSSNDFEKVLPIYLEGYEASLAAHGLAHEQTGKYLNYLTACYQQLNQPQKALPFLQKNNDNISARIQQTLPILYEKGRVAFVESLEESSSVVYNFTKKYPTLGASYAYNMSLATKGVVLEYTQNWKKNLEKTDNPTLRKLYHNWVEQKQQLAYQYSLTNEKRIQKLDSIEQHTYELEDQLSQQSASFLTANQQVSWQEVQHQLKAKELVVEFIHYKYHDGKTSTDSVLYAALILRKNDTSPIFVPLFAEKTLKKLLDYGMKEADKSNLEYHYLYLDAPTRLYKNIWQPLETYLKDAESVYYAPSGLLDLVSFDAIAYEDKKYLAQRYKQFRRLRSSRSLVIGLQDTGFQWDKNSKILYFGNVEYQANGGNVVNTDGSNVQNGRTISGNCIFKPLSNTAQEFETINTLTNSNQLQNFSKQKSDASEDYFKNIIQNNASPDVLLFSTHGFYQSKPTFNTLNALLANSEPLCRSGIALANANYAWCEGEPLPQREDGLLTAYEIANMDLSNTQLVVLAACRSGIGALQGSEGVNGLQRAFKIAGVKTLLVALWDVDNAYAQDFITTFYRKILTGASPKTAFDQTQQNMIQSNKYIPSVWGAFVLVE